MTKRFSAPLLAAAALALAALPAPLHAQQRAATVVVGQVMDANTGTPLSSAIVAIPHAGVRAVTGSDGQFRVRLRPGTHEVTLARLGYQDGATRWEVGDESLDAGVLPLPADPVLLEGITATVDRLEEVRRSVGITSRTFAERDLATSASRDAADFVTLRASTFAMACNGGGTPVGAECVRSRGAIVRACVVVDDQPLAGGLVQLKTYQASDFARMHVYRGGTFIQAYTPRYVERLARTNTQPMTALEQLRRYCRASA